MTDLFYQYKLLGFLVYVPLVYNRLCLTTNHGGGKVVLEHSLLRGDNTNHCLR